MRGEVRLHLHNRESQLFAAGRPGTLGAPDGTRRRAGLRSRPGAGGRVLGRIDGLRDREEARALMGFELVIAKAALPQTESNEYYHHELLGLAVETESGRALGTLAEIHDSGAVDVWVVRGEDEHFLPALAEVFLSVDVPGGRAVVADDAVDR